MAKLINDFITPVIGTGMGLITANWQDRRQVEQQQKLTDIQVKAQKELAENSRKQQLQMWKDTNYQQQVEQMKLAGLNPALMYGQAGAGGQLGAGTNGSVGSGTAQGGSGEIGMGIQLAQQQKQLELLDAQKRNIEADTTKKEAEAGNLGANTKLTGEQTTALEIENAFQKWRNDDEAGMGQSQAKQELMKKIQLQSAEIRNLEQEFKLMGVDLNNIEASTKQIKASTELQQQLKAQLEKLNPIQIALMKTASKMSDAQLKRFENDPKNTQTGMYIDYGFGKLKDLVDMGTDIYGAKTFRELLNKDTGTDWEKETMEQHPNGKESYKHETYRRKK